MSVNRELNAFKGDFKLFSIKLQHSNVQIPGAVVFRMRHRTIGLRMRYLISMLIQGD